MPSRRLLAKRSSNGQHHNSVRKLNQDATTQEKQGVQNYCSSFLSLPPQKTKTFLNLDTSTVYTGTSMTTMTTYMGSFSGAPNTRTQMLTVTAAGAPTTTVTTTVSGGAQWVWPSQCGQAPTAVAARDVVEKRQTAVQPVCFSKYAVKTQITSACSCFTLTATVAKTTLVESTTTISTASMVTTTSTVFGAEVITSTSTVSTVTSTSTVNSGPTVSAFALMDGASGNYAASDSDVLHFSYGAGSEGAFTLDSNGNIAQGTGNYPGNKGWQMVSQTPDFIRFGNPASYGVSYNYVTCTIQNSGGSCSLVCSVNGQTQNCLYNYPNDSRDGSWILGSATNLCQNVSPPLIKPLPASSYQ